MREQVGNSNWPPYLEGAPGPTSTGAPSGISPQDAEIARMRAAAGIEAPEPRPEAGTAPESALMSKSGTFDGVPPPDYDYHRDPYHGVEAYQGTLDGVAWPSPSPAEACGAKARALKGCGCGVEIVPDHCDRLECSQPYCEQRNRDRRAGDIYERLEAARGTKWLLYYVFTVPPALRARVARPGAWQKLLARLIHRLRVYHKLQYAVERSDPAGEDLVRWHPHFNLVWIRTDGRGSLPLEEIAEIRWAWKQILYTEELKEIRRRVNAGELDLEASLGQLLDLEAAPLNIYASFIPDGQYSRDGRDLKADRLHLASYMGRPWARWAKTQKYMLRVKWFGKPPKLEEKVGPRTCRKCGFEVVCMAVGSEEEAARLRALGYDRLVEEHEIRKKHFRRMAKVKPPKFCATVSAEGTTWKQEVR